MIHSPRVIARIVDLLKLSGVSNDASIEELTDHYLTQIEVNVDGGISEQRAIRETYQEIATADLKGIDHTSIQKNKWIIGTLFISLLLLLMIVKCKKVQAPTCIASNQTFSLPTGWPIEGNINEITSGFGLRTHPIERTKKFHKGIDIKAKSGTNVVATGDGKVVEAQYSPSNGYYIIVEHNDHYSTKYAHLSKYQVESCQKVKKGEIIGQVGSSGMSLAPHLHYEVIKNKQVVDPLSLVAP